MTTQKTRIQTYDTTLRDGTQTQGVSLSLKDKLEVAEALDALGVDYIEGGYPLSNPKDEQFFAEIRKMTFRNAKIAAFGMTRRKEIKAADDVGMQALLNSEAPAVTIVGKSWNLHVTDVLRVSEDENLRMIFDSVEIMAKAGREAIYDAEHFFDGYRANPDFAMKTLQAAHDAGAQALVLCDTNGGSLPEQITQILQEIRKVLPDAVLGIHCHNDSDLAVANTLAAVRAGVTQVQGTINGIGERCGNADLVSVLANLGIKMGYDVLKDGSMENLTSTSRFVYEIANLNFREGQPFVGSNAFAHKGGMHVHAVQRNVDTYEHISPDAIGNKRRILVSELSGISNIAATVPAKFNIAEDKTAQRHILKTIMDLENEGYEFDAAEASFEMIVRKTLGGKWYRKLWDLDHYRCVILRRHNEEALTEVTTKLTMDGESLHTVAEGDGPVDSLMNSLKLALRKKYPSVDDLHLVDYRVRVINTSAETAASVRVVIDWRDASNDTYFGSVGVDENIIDASWLAIVDAIEFKLLTVEELRTQA
ncbi:MAG: citramalate synthase [Phycisphaerae bacterium]|nr:citramalate synthase [Phycisphaerae bacterium]